MRVEGILPPPFEWVEIPAGKVTLDERVYVATVTTFDVPAFAISKYPITNAQFTEFIWARGYEQKQWWTEEGWQWKLEEQWGAPRFWVEEKWNGADYPVVGVSWYEAVAFCNWLTAQWQPALLTTLSPGEWNEDYRAMASKAMVEIARDLRQQQTSAEIILWECVRNRRLAGLKFRRQHPIAGTNYVADFLNYEQRLVIELDGAVHENQQTEDALRQTTIESLGYRVIRFRNERILNDLENSLITLLQAVNISLQLGEGQGVRAITLPTDQQWQRAAQGDDRRKYPWGNEWDDQCCNNSIKPYESAQTTSVRQYEGKGDSPFGVVDMSGNVWEWCRTGAASGTQDLNGREARVQSGGAWNSLREGCFSTSFYGGDYPWHRDDEVGFRIAMNMPSP